VADLLAHFGPIAHRRIRQDPAPGTAVEQDVLDIHDREKRLYELLDGVLVEKAMGVQESFLAIVIAGLLGPFARLHDLGFVLGADGMARLAPGLVRSKSCVPVIRPRNWTANYKIILRRA
jgi:hypothetical protein